MFRAHIPKSQTEEGPHWFLNHSIECRESVLAFLWEYHKNAEHVLLLSLFFHESFLFYHLPGAGDKS
jgi:hypothetical protein